MFNLPLPLVQIVIVNWPVQDLQHVKIITYISKSLLYNPVIPVHIADPSLFGGIWQRLYLQYVRYVRLSSPTVKAGKETKKQCQYSYKQQKTPLQYNEVNI